MRPPLVVVAVGGRPVGLAGWPRVFELVGAAGTAVCGLIWLPGVCLIDVVVGVADVVLDAGVGRGVLVGVGMPGPHLLWRGRVVAGCATVAGK